MEFIAREAALIFFAIVFIQSAVDKIQDFEGNLGWLTGHFENSPLKDHVPLLLKTLTGLEACAGALSAIAALVHLFSGATGLAIGAMFLSGVCLLALFFGQRMAKDYEGAATITNYFAVWLLSAMMF